MSDVEESIMIVENPENPDNPNIKAGLVKAVGEEGIPTRYLDGIGCEKERRDAVCSWGWRYTGKFWTSRLVFASRV